VLTSAVTAGALLPLHAAVGRTRRPVRLRTALIVQSVLPAGLHRGVAAALGVAEPLVGLAVLAWTVTAVAALRPAVGVRAVRYGPNERVEAATERTSPVRPEHVCSAR
jgi:hypothetical protein